MYPKIISSTTDDEELLIPSAQVIRQQRSLNGLAKPPSCCCGLLNTRCGSFFIAALQLTYGMIHLFCCMAYFRADVEQIEETKIKNLPVSDEAYLEAMRMYLSMFIAMFSIASGLLTFHGLSFNKEKLIRPAIILYTTGILACLVELVYMVIYWDDVSTQLRQFLKFYTKNIESTIQEEILIEESNNLDTFQETEDLKIWKQIENMINDEDTWVTYTKGYLMTLISGCLMLNVTIFSWFGWILVNQSVWIRQRRVYEELI